MSPDDDAPTAELASACRRFGTVTALAGLDVAEQRGKVLALLGTNGDGIESRDSMRRLYSRLRITAILWLMAAFAGIAVALARAAGMP